MTTRAPASACRGEFGGCQLAPYRQNGHPVTMSYKEARASLVGCPRCGYLRFDPIPNETFLARYYAEQYWDHGALLETAKNEYAFAGYRLQTAEILRAWAQYGAAGRAPRVHDVGCGVGTLVHHLRQQGIHATGSDLSTHAIAAGYALGNAALHCASLTDYLTSHAAERIDIFLMSHALEHVPDPVDTLREIRAHLPRDGMVWLRVPNGLYQGARGRSWYDFQWLQFPNHIHYFTPRSLQCSLAAAGLALAEVSATTREDTPDRLLSDLLGRAAARPDALLHALAQNLLTQELQAVAVVDGSPRMPADVATLVDKVEPPGWAAPTEPRAVPVQNSVEFSTAAQGRYGWRYQWSAVEPERFVDMTHVQDGLFWLGPDGSQIGWNWILLQPGSRLRLSYRPPPAADAGAAARMPARVRCDIRSADHDAAASSIVRIGAGERVRFEQAIVVPACVIDTVLDLGDGEAVTFDFWTTGGGGRRSLIGLSVERLAAGG